jgi:hypothetical protein
MNYLWSGFEQITIKLCNLFTKVGRQGIYDAKISNNISVKLSSCWQHLLRPLIQQFNVDSSGFKFMLVVEIKIGV